MALQVNTDAIWRYVNSDMYDTACNIVENISWGYDGVKASDPDTWYDPLMEEIDNALIYYHAQWELLKAYCTPQEANFDEAVTAFTDELMDALYNGALYNEEPEDEDDPDSDDPEY